MSTTTTMNTITTTITFTSPEFSLWLDNSAYLQPHKTPPDQQTLTAVSSFSQRRDAAESAALWELYREQKGFPSAERLVISVILKLVRHLKARVCSSALYA